MKVCARDHKRNDNDGLDRIESGARGYGDKGTNHGEKREIEERLQVYVATFCSERCVVRVFCCYKD